MAQKKFLVLAFVSACITTAPSRHTPLLEQPRATAAPGPVSTPENPDAGWPRKLQCSVAEQNPCTQLRVARYYVRTRPGKTLHQLFFEPDATLRRRICERFFLRNYYAELIEHAGEKIAETMEYLERLREESVEVHWESVAFLRESKAHAQKMLAFARERIQGWRKRQQHLQKELDMPGESLKSGLRFMVEEDLRKAEEWEKEALESQAYYEQELAGISASARERREALERGEQDNLLLPVEKRKLWAELDRLEDMTHAD